MDASSPICDEGAAPRYPNVAQINIVDEALAAGTIFWHLFVTMFDIVLFQPQIPPNTGNIIRLCANSGARLHLIQPLGFSLDVKSCRRAGLDYRELVDVTQWPDFQSYRNAVPQKRIWAVTKFGPTRYDAAPIGGDDALLFGSETAGLPADVTGMFDEREKLYLPMIPGTRALNLSNAVAICLYDAWRQVGFPE